MAPVASARRKPSSSRPSRPRPKLTPNRNGADPGDEPPPKRRRYVPGGPGGGGRYVDVDGTETPAVSIPPSGGYNSSSGSRSRSGRDSTSKNTKSQVARPSTPMATPASTRPKREKAQPRRFSTANAAAVSASAAVQCDGYKPREERGWEEFHPELDIEAKFAIFSSDEVDGLLRQPPSVTNAEETNPPGESAEGTPNASQIPIKRGPGRPPRYPNAMLNGIGTPETPKLVPPPGPNPREVLTLPKPSFRRLDPFVRYEQKGVGQQNYVDRTMASVGYQESDLFIRQERGLIRMAEGAPEEDLDLGPLPATADGDGNASQGLNAAIGSVGVGRVEYDMDEQDEKWLEVYNAMRKEEEVEPIKPAIFEITMTKIEKEWHALEKRIPKPNPKPPQTHRPRSSSAAAVNGEPPGSGEEQDSKCAVCDDGDCENANAIVFCDGCDLAVHQECYGVPYIPEGQWLCRKCQLIGRASTSCIFCPNVEGAFKQTNTSKWSHLLCAIWIPEVSIGNPSLMEPVNDVEKVPRNRWKLSCYICKQKMGACIQCSNKSCYQAFHVTCARRAGLFLKMKSGHASPVITESHMLKAFCDKHVPLDWRRDHNTGPATAEAFEFYKNTMAGKRWGDSQAAALALGPSYAQGFVEPGEEDSHRMMTPRITLTVGGNKRKRATTGPKTVWRLPSGAPVIPQVVLNSVVASLQRFTVRQRKQYAEDACKYWTLKREARRGAALLKRLQLQLETFSSMEMTRRNFAGMGVAGGVRLQRRIDFADRLSDDVDTLKNLCNLVKQRESDKLKDAETLRSIVDIVYFPIPPMLWPIFEKAQALDPRGVFRQGMLPIRSKLVKRNYTSVSAFSADLATVFTSEIGVDSVGDTAELQMQISGRAPELSLEQREKRKLAKRIIKSIQPALESAIKKESELNGKPFEKELKDLDMILEGSVLSRRASLVGSAGDVLNEGETLEEQSTVPNGVSTTDNEPVLAATKKHPSAVNQNAGVTPECTSIDEREALKMIDGNHGPAAFANEDIGMSVEAGNGCGAVDSLQNDSTMATTDEVPHLANGIKKEPQGQPLKTRAEPPTPPLSFEGGDQQLPLAQGGIQWYMQPFDPVGTTIFEERWTGREVLRGMSEELSEIDEDDLRNLVDTEFDENAPGVPVDTAQPTDGDAVADDSKVKVHRTRRRWRGFK